MNVSEWRRWKKENPSFPLAVHAAGQWYKVALEKTYYCGVLDDPDAALAQWKKFEPLIEEIKALRKKLAAKERDSKTGVKKGLTVAVIFRRFIKDANKRIKAGRLAESTLQSYKLCHAILKKAGVLGFHIDNMTPEMWARVAEVIQFSGLSLNSQKQRITNVKTIYRWGNQMGWYPPPIWGPRFQPANLVDIQSEREDKGIKRYIEPDVIRRAIRRAEPKLRLAILLGINCGFYASDSVMIRERHINMATPIAWHGLRRKKTRQKRAAALWPETEDMIRRYSHLYEKTTPAALNVAFRRLLKGMGEYVEGVGLGSLRHTFATVVAGVEDQDMIDLAMGHTPKSVSKKIYVQVTFDMAERLKVLSDEVHEWLFGRPAPSPWPDDS